MDEEDRRAYDKSITTLTMAVERLADSQSIMTQDIRELTKAVSKFDVVMEKMMNLESRHVTADAAVNSRLRALEANQTKGCPALRETKVVQEARYESVIKALEVNRKHIEDIQGTTKKVVFGIFTLIAGAIVEIFMRSV